MKSKIESTTKRHAARAFPFSQTIQIQNATMTLICINTSADYAGGKKPGSVYQPKSKEAIFNSLEKHTLREDF